MKKLLLLLISVFLYTGIALAAGPITAKVTRTNHKTAVKKDAVDKGTFSYKPGGTMSIVFSETDKLMMEGTKYTIVRGKRSSVAKGETAALFGVMQAVVDDILSGGNGMVKDAASKGVSVTQNGNDITIAPAGKTKKKLLFSSFVLRVDKKKHQVLSIRMNGKGKNYTLYEILY